MYKYKELATNKIVMKEQPIQGRKKRDFQLMEWRRNTQMKGAEIKQKDVELEDKQEDKQEVATPKKVVKTEGKKVEKKNKNK